MDKNSEIDFLFQYFLSQSDENFNAVLRTQKGNGIGNFFGGLNSSILPLFKKGSFAIGREIMRNTEKSIENNPETALKRKAPVTVIKNRKYKRMKKSRKPSHLQLNARKKKTSSTRIKKIKKIKIKKTKKKKVSKKVIKVGVSEN